MTRFEAKLDLSNDISRGDLEIFREISTVLHHYEGSENGMWGTASNFPAFNKVVHAFSRNLDFSIP